MSENKDHKFVINYRYNNNLKYFINGKNVRSYSSKGTATPDHVIRVKPFPLVITPKKIHLSRSLLKQLKKLLRIIGKNTSIILKLTVKRSKDKK